jgi:hypothetical protein
MILTGKELYAMYYWGVWGNIAIAGVRWDTLTRGKQVWWGVLANKVEARSSYSRERIDKMVKYMDQDIEVSDGTPEDDLRVMLRG